MRHDTSISVESNRKTNRIASAQFYDSCHSTMAPKSTSPHRLEMASPSMDSDDVSPRKLSAISLDDKYNDNEGDDENDA